MAQILHVERNQNYIFFIANVSIEFEHEIEYLLLQNRTKQFRMHKEQEVVNKTDGEQYIFIKEYETFDFI